MTYKEFKDMELSALGMGNMRLPTVNDVPHGEIDYARAQEIIDYAMSHGINYYDTAYTYPGSEAFLGTAMKKYPRDSYFLATKYWIDANPDYAAVFEEQLQKLQTDHIDFYLLHSMATALSYLLGGAVVDFFAKGNAHVAAVALRGFHIVAISFLMLAYNTFSSGWLTALNDGKTSAILSFCRTMIFLVLPVLVLPRLLGVDGVWLSLSAGEMLSLGMGIYYFRKFRRVWTPAP